MTKKMGTALVAAALGILALAVIGCAHDVNQQAAVSGVVVSEGLVQEGAQVKQGDVLVRVKALAGGSIAAARAATDGCVSKVLVAPGDKLVPQQIVAKISK